MSAEQVIAAAREVLACEAQRLRFKVALPDSPRHKDWGLLKQFPASHSAAWLSLISALAALDAEAEEPQQITWEEECARFFAADPSARSKT